MSVDTHAEWHDHYAICMYCRLQGNIFCQLGRKLFYQFRDAGGAANYPREYARNEIDDL